MTDAMAKLLEKNNVHKGKPNLVGSKEILTANGNKQVRLSPKEVIANAKQKENEAVARFDEISSMIPSCNKHSQDIYNKFISDKTFQNLLQEAVLKISENESTNNQGGQAITVEIIDEVLEKIEPEDEVMKMVSKMLQIVKPKAIKEVKETDLESIRDTFLKLRENILKNLRTIDEYKDKEGGEGVINAATKVIDLDKSEIGKIVLNNRVLFNNINFEDQILNVHDGDIKKALEVVENILKDRLNKQTISTIEVDNSLKQSDLAQQQLPLMYLNKAKDQIEKAYARGTAQEINPVTEIAILFKAVNSSSDTFAITREDRRSFLNSLSAEEKKELIIKINQAISSQGFDKTNDNIIAGLDEQIHNNRLLSQGKDFTYSLLNTKLQELIREIKALGFKSQDYTPNNLKLIILNALENHDSNTLNFIDSNLVKTKSIQLYDLLMKARQLSEEIIEPLERTKQKLESYFEQELSHLELTFDQALEASANNVDTIYDFLSLYKEDPLIIDTLEEGQKKDIIRLVLDQLKEEPNASLERKKQIFSAYIKLGISALEAERSRTYN